MYLKTFVFKFCCISFDENGFVNRKTKENKLWWLGNIVSRGGTDAVHVVKDMYVKGKR